MMHVTLHPEGAHIFVGTLEGWTEKPALQVYVGSLDNNAKYCGWWCTEEWQEGERTGRNHLLFASGTLYPQEDGSYVGEIVHMLRGSKVRGWRATARKGSRVVEFEPI